MPTDMAGNGQIRPQIRWPAWVGYAVTICLEVGLTAVLKALLPHFPLAQYPIPYILVIMAVAYLFGEGPAILAFFTGLVAFVYFFVYPVHFFWPPAATPTGWARLTAFLIGTLIVGFATVLMRRARHRIQGLAEELGEAKRLAEYRWTQLETILASMTAPVMVTDRDQKMVYANEAATRLVRARREIGQPLETWVRAANLREMDGSPIRMEDHPLTKSLAGETVTERLLLTDGESGPDTVVSASAAPIRRADGEISGAVVIARNITLQRQLQVEVERQRALLDAFMDNVPVGLGFHDRDTRHVFANRTLVEMNRKPVEEVIGKTVWEVLPAGLAEATAAAIEKAFSTGEPSFWHDHVVTFDIERYFDVNHIPVRTAGGEIIGVGVVVVETTEQVLARRELERNYDREHRIAETLQDGLVGTVPRRLDRFEFETVYRAARDEARVGGDFYDVFRMGDGKIGIAIGDVSGKGLQAAVQMAMAKYSLRSRAYESDRPSTVMEQVNKALVQDMGDESFVTIFAGVLDPKAMTVTYANAGHSPAILWKAAERQAVLLDSTGPVVGIMDDMTYQDETVQLQPGDELLLGTDGLFEVRCKEAFLEIEGLLGLYTGLRQSGVYSATGLVDRVIEFCQGELRDDVAILRVTVVE